MGNKDEVVQPQHKICISNVDVPTVVLTHIIDATNPSHPKQKEPTMSIQWFGQAGVRLPESSQFLFTLLTDPQSIEWWKNPQSFRVVFLGQIKDWPKIESIQKMVEAFGDKETWIVWLVSSIIGMKHSDGIGPASYAVKVALLGDGNCGIITPQLYTNMGVLEEENRKVAVH